jgi:hypothetical protein
MPARLLVLLALLLIGCDNERLAKLEKKNQDLMAEIKKDRAVSDYDMQAKCARDSKVWFDENFGAGRDKDTLLLTYSNHYNKSQNKCFVVVEYHHRYDKQWWANMITLWDVYENSKYGSISINHYTDFKPKFQTREELLDCEVFDKKCGTLDEFNSLARPYLND